VAASAEIACEIVTHTLINGDVYGHGHDHETAPQDDPLYAPLRGETGLLTRTHAASRPALIGAELAERLGVLDIAGRQPPSHRRTLGRITNCMKP
jgi:hypothetical protein